MEQEEFNDFEQTPTYTPPPQPQTQLPAPQPNPDLHQFQGVFGESQAPSSILLFPDLRAFQFSQPQEVSTAILPSQSQSPEYLSELNLIVEQIQPPKNNTEESSFTFALGVTAEPVTSTLQEVTSQFGGNYLWNSSSFNLNSQIQPLGSTNTIYALAPQQQADPLDFSSYGKVNPIQKIAQEEIQIKDRQLEKPVEFVNEPQVEGLQIKESLDQVHISEGQQDFQYGEIVHNQSIHNHQQFPGEPTHEDIFQVAKNGSQPEIVENEGQDFGHFSGENVEAQTNRQANNHSELQQQFKEALPNHTIYTQQEAVISDWQAQPQRQTQSEADGDDDEFGDFAQGAAEEPLPPNEEDNRVAVSNEVEEREAKQRQLQAFVDSLPDYSYLFQPAFLQ